ncbi:hypothetical protein ACFSCX_06380 [Bacillus salitolerans]|uniref:Uncharacterized protein n=1 Tax=Bacillus salitolerans TaxID=1437434 RepID=A0ABW4LM11_9BACI
MQKNTWTDGELQTLLEELGYDFTNENGEINGLSFSQEAVNNGYSWNSSLSVWEM